MLNVNQGYRAVSLCEWCPLIWDPILPRMFGRQSLTGAAPLLRRTDNSTTPPQRPKGLIVNTLGNETLMKNHNNIVSFAFKISSKNEQKASARKPDPFRISKSRRIIFILFAL
jgi:hypothetical protein